MSPDDLNRALTRIAHEILERNKGTDELALVGIRSRGVFLAERLRKNVQEIEGGAAPPFGVVDITLYRDDLDRGVQNPIVKGTDIPIAVDGRRILLVDDVLFTGRTIRAVINELFDFGRPHSVDLAVLVDRGGRELPIQASFAAAKVVLPARQRLTLARGDAGRFSFSLEDKL